MSPHDGGSTHLDPDGRPRMVDVSDKDVTPRRAVAVGRIRMAPGTLRILLEGGTGKGDPLQVAQLAGIQAGKRTGELVPLCHLLPEVSFSLRLEPDPELPGVVATAEARHRGRTGVELEALTAVTVALLTVYDMLKSADRGMILEGIRLLRKEGGRSGTWDAAGEEPPGSS